MKQTKKTNKASKTNKGLLPWIIGALVLIAILVLALIAGKYIYRTFVDPMSAFEPAATQPQAVQPTGTPGADAALTPEPVITLSPEELAAQEEAALRSEADANFMKNRVNILMLGWDESPERNDSSSALYRDEENNFRSDVIMLLTIDFNRGKADLVSVPRDSLYPLYTDTGELWRENSHYKINAAFAKGGSAKGQGFGYAMQTVSHLLGVPINNYVGVNMEGLKAVVDAMGGVDYDVDVRISLNGRVLETGYQHLDGQQVLDYCRARKGISTDVGRNDRQQRMLFAIFDQLKTTRQLVKFPKIYQSVKDYIYTDLNFQQISSLCAFGLDLDMASLGRHTLGGEYVNNTSYSGASYYVLHAEEVKALTMELFGFETDFPLRYDAPYVLADKAGSDALKYVEAARYVYTLVGADFELRNDPMFQRPELYAVNAAVEAVYAAAQRMIPLDATEEELNAIMDIPLDKEACDLAAQQLHDALYGVLTARGYTRSTVDKKALPDALYKALPEAAPTLP